MSPPGLGRRRRVRPVLQRVPTTDGVSLAVDLYPCAKPRAAVLLLHGGGQSRHAWDATAQRLHARGYLAAAYDARGHGGDSDWDPDGRYDLDRLGGDLLAVRSHAAGGHPVVAIGASLGGLTILGTHLLASPDLWDAWCWWTSLHAWRCRAHGASSHSWRRTPPTVSPILSLPPRLSPRTTHTDRSQAASTDYGRSCSSAPTTVGYGGGIRPLWRRILASCKVIQMRAQRSSTG